jgi:hypothetical protein
MERAAGSEVKNGRGRDQSIAPGRGFFLRARMVYDSRRSDYSSRAGAERLARAIAQHWQAKGVAVEARIEPAGADELGRPVYAVRTDLAFRGRPREIDR